MLNPYTGTIPGPPHSSPTLNLSAVLKIYRKTLNLGLPEMAQILKIPKTILYRFECGHPIAQGHLITIWKWLLTEE